MDLTITAVVMDRISPSASSRNISLKLMIACIVESEDSLQVGKGELENSGGLEGMLDHVLVVAPRC